MILGTAAALATVALGPSLTRWSGSLLLVTIVAAIVWAARRSTVAALTWIVVAIPAVRHSGILWGQFLVREGGRSEDVSRGYVLIAITCAAMTAIGLALVAQRETWASMRSSLSRVLAGPPLYSAHLVLAGMGLAVGAALLNEPRGILSDTFNLVQPALVLWLAYLAGRATTEGGTERMLDALGIVLASFALFNAAVSLVVFKTLSSAAGGSPAIALGVLFFASRLRFGRGHVGWNLVFLALSLVPVVTSLKRGIWVALAAWVALALLVRFFEVARGRDGRAAKRWATGVCVGVAALALFWSPISARWDRITAETTFLVQLQGRLERLSGDQFGARTDEVDSALRNLRLAGGPAWFVGTGSGAGYTYLSDGRLVRTDEHNIHVTPVAVLYRHGGVGLTVYLLALAVTLVWLFMKRNEHPALWLAANYCVLLHIAALTAYTAVPDLVLPTLIGLGLAGRDAAQRAGTPTTT